MTRKPYLAAAAASAALAGGLAVAKADNLLPFGPVHPAVDQEAARQRAIAKTAFTEVLANRAETLGMRPPLNLAPYAPIYPDGMILYESLAGDSDTGGQVQYAAAAPLEAALDFYEDAAALHHLAFAVKRPAPDSVIFEATAGPRHVEARLSRQFKNGTEVDLAYN
jgi:hypothetical protein